MQRLLHNETVIADTLQRGPAITHVAADGGWQFSRWHQFVGSYSLPALPLPIFVVQLAGKSDVRLWDRSGWSEWASFPGAATLVPAGCATRWLVDGELDVVTFSAAPHDLFRPADAADRIRFAYSDPLATALSTRMLDELYEPGNPDDYLYCLAHTLSRHLVSRSARHPMPSRTAPDFGSFRINRVVQAMHAAPDAELRLADMANQAGVAEAHLCRLFKQAVGVTPHQYLLTLRMERACSLLSAGEATIADVAASSGFGGQSHFARAFRQRFGETPSSYRSRMQRQ